ncbi:FMN-binding negative transcriptional regulator [Novosphingobium humi]|uniref:FMN-binding negative transcriptional regulator n=1 Tax=Novosphingobium humi TaxID=2282397 RepID=A0ABY7TVT6_9SPHN|nr:FMN-binding negative transcriptional regulator [Novosphingobium humi]WCT76480.1 FMN-binding negative transcriptional regulator [Novosphingobium humi]
MHPNPAFRHDDRALFERLIREIGFGMVFAATPDGPRVAHVPLVSDGNGTVQFHLARGNALARHLHGMVALAVVNGPDAYVSPRWYGHDPNQVPTWNYVALEMEGPVRRMDRDGLFGLLEALSAQEEAKLPPPAWTMEKSDPAYIDKLMGAIVGFEMEVQAWRPTFKLSQNKSAEMREQVAAGLEEVGSHAVAAMMRGLV